MGTVESAATSKSVTAVFLSLFFILLAITRLWRFVVTAFRKKVGLIISTKSHLAVHVCVLIIFFNM